MSFSERLWPVNLFGSAFDWPTAAAFAVMTLVYLLAPWLGYRPRSRSLVLGALWVLLAKVAAGSLKVLLGFVMVVSKSFKGKDGETLFALINCLEAGVFLLALVLFVVGLSLLKREEQAPAVAGRPRSFED